MKHNRYLLIGIVYGVILVTNYFNVLSHQINPDDLTKKLLQSSQSIYFIENLGQIKDQNGKVNSDVLFVAQIENGTISIRKDGISFNFFRFNTLLSQNKNSTKDFRFEKFLHTKASLQTVESYRLDMNLINSLAPTKIHGLESSNESSHYYLDHCPNGITNVRKYKSICIENVFANIDLVLFSNKENQFQYDFVVKPGANPLDIRFRFDGATSVEVNQYGSLILSTPFGTIEQKAPKSFHLENSLSYTSGQLNSKNTQSVSSEYSKNVDSTISFTVDNYNKHLPLVIEPTTRVWGTYFGGNWEESSSAIAIDNSTNIYLCGYTNSINTIASTGAHQTTLERYTDAFIAMFDSIGARIWSTYYGGNHEDGATDIAISKLGDIYVCGNTKASNVISTEGSHQFTLGGGNDAFLVKFDQKGTRMWGTYYGGLGSEWGSSLDVDENGDIYLCGSTSSLNSIATQYAFDTILSGQQDVFLAKFNSNGERVWGTYFGGNGSDEPNNIAIDKNGFIYVCGSTRSTEDIATSGSFQENQNGFFDAFLSKFTPDGIRLWATYYGGIGYDVGTEVTTFNGEDIYLCGRTSSLANISSSEAFQMTHGGNYFDAFLVKFDKFGNRVWGTYYGGLGNDNALSTTTDNFGNIYFCGSTSSNDFIATSGAYKTSKVADTTAYFVKFSPKGDRQFGSYYGGNHYDYANSILVDNNKLYLYGSTKSSVDIATPNSFKPNNTYGDFDVFLVKFDLGTFTSVHEQVENITSIQTNIFESKVDINVLLNQSSVLSIKMYDILGNEVTQMFQGFKESGEHTFSANINSLTQGMYFIQIKTDFDITIESFYIIK